MSSDNKMGLSVFTDTKTFPYINHIVPIFSSSFISFMNIENISRFYITFVFGCFYIFDIEFSRTILEPSLNIVNKTCTIHRSVM